MIQFDSKKNPAFYMLLKNLGGSDPRNFAMLTPVQQVVAFLYHKFPHAASTEDILGELKRVRPNVNLNVYNEFRRHINEEVMRILLDDGVIHSADNMFQLTEKFFIYMKTPTPPPPKSPEQIARETKEAAEQQRREEVLAGLGFKIVLKGQEIEPKNFPHHMWDDNDGNEINVGGVVLTKEEAQALYCELDHLGMTGYT